MVVNSCAEINTVSEGISSGYISRLIMRVMLPVTNSALNYKHFKWSLEVGLSAQEMYSS